MVQKRGIGKVDVGRVMLFSVLIGDSFKKSKADVEIR